MVRQIIWSQRSLELLKEILDYWIVRNGSGTYSEKLYSLFQVALERLASYPDSGRPTENSKIRYKQIRNYYLYFTFDKQSLKVVAVSHVKRSPEYIESLLK